ncbi:MAG: 3-deoxy-D-manno-octulosonic acid transferase [Synergistota bacterium]|nr:3-deoxy-D-manno-octulosonic acid transferase [Synergistota bacterium]
MKYRDGRGERFGKYGDLFKGYSAAPLWVHAVSVGEVQAAVPLMRALKKDEPETKLFLTTITVTGRAMASRLAGDIVDRNAYYPWDAPWAVSRAIDSISPAGFVTLETEIWPNFVAELAKRNIPAFIVNGRFSERSFRKALKQKRFWKDILSLFTKIMVRDESDALRLAELGVDKEKTLVTGDCKVDALIDRTKKMDRVLLREKLDVGLGPVLLAGSTHTGEDECVLEAFSRVRKTFPDVRLIIAPRHPERAETVAGIAKEYGSVTLFSQISGRWDILVVDEIGWLFGLYEVASSAFVGGSLVPRGGQNLLEAAIWGTPIQHGPFMDDFARPAAELARLGGATTVTDSRRLAEEWERVLRNPETVDRKSGADYVKNLGGASGICSETVRANLNSGE